MRALKKTTALLISALLVFALAPLHAAYGSVTVTQVDGLNAEGKIEDGATLTFHMNLQNPYASPIGAMDNGYWFRSDGMTWGPLDGAWNLNYCWSPLQVPACSPVIFDMGHFMKINGDTIGFGGINFMMGSGLVSGFNDVAYYITVGPIALNEGTYLTMDSCKYDVNEWCWSISMVGEVVCNWGGPYTWDYQSSCDPAAFVTTTLPDGVVGTAYAHTVEVTGTAPFTFELVSAPAGLVINDDGDLYWETPVAGDYNFEIFVHNGCSDVSETFSLTICAPPAITSTEVTEATVGQPYTYQVTATGSADLVYTVVDPPVGMNCVATTGLITWLPDAAGDYTIRVEVSNDCGMDFQEFVITVCEPVVITTLALPDGQAGIAYSFDIEETGSTPYIYELITGPEFMEIDEATGALSWLDPVGGTHVVEVGVTNHCGGDEETFSLYICEPPEITTDPATAPDGTVGVLYEFLIEATGIPAPTFGIVTPPPAPGDMEIDPVTGLLTWTPTSAGDFDVTIEATNDCGIGDAIAINIVVNEAPAAIDITSSAPVTGQITVGYVYDVEATGNPAPTYSLLDAPATAVINPTTGLIEWTPTESGIFHFHVKAENYFSFDEEIWDVTVCDPAAITTTMLPDGVAGVAYAATVEATGYPAPTFNLSVAPAGMAIDLNTGDITWPVPVVGSHLVTVEATNTCNTAVFDYTVNICEPPAITTTELPEGLINDPYVAVIEATGDGDLTFALTAGAVGDMAIDPATGELTWTPGTAGDFDITVEVSSDCGGPATAGFTITVLEFNEPFCWLEPSPLYLKDLPEDRVVKVFIKDPNLMAIDLASVRIQGKIPCYSNEGEAYYDDPLNPTMVISDAFVFRFLSAWRPIREEDMPNNEAGFTVTYSYDFAPGDLVTVDSTFILDWDLLVKDLNLDGYANQEDIDLLVNYLWKSGPASPWEEMMDVDGNGKVNSADVRTLMDKID